MPRLEPSADSSMDKHRLNNSMGDHGGGAGSARGAEDIVMVCFRWVIGAAHKTQRSDPGE